MYLPGAADATHAPFIPPADVPSGLCIPLQTAHVSAGFPSPEKSNAVKLAERPLAATRLNTLSSIVAGTLIVFVTNTIQ